MKQEAPSLQWAWLAGLATGALAMYLADPEKGRRRRAIARDKLQSFAVRAGDALDVTSRDFGNRIQGMRARANRALSAPEAVSDDQLLVDRARSMLGRAVSHPHSIRIAASRGRLELSGPILASEHEQLLRMMNRVPGVTAVVDLLDLHRTRDIPGLQGEGRQRQRQPVFLHEHWPPAVRAASLLGGGVLGYCGLQGRSGKSALLSIAGLALMARALTNMPFTRIVQEQAQSLPVQIEKSIYIAAPVDTVFDLWSNYENFPLFMSHVQDVRDLGSKRSHWTVSGPGGMVLEWDSLLTESRRPEVLAWTSEPDSPLQQAGRIRFERTSDGTTVHVLMSWLPPGGALGRKAAALFNGDARKQLEQDLLRMKSFIESRGMAADTLHSAGHPGATLH